MNRFLVLFLAIGFYAGLGEAASVVESSSVREFSPDGCSLFPEGTFGDPNRWAHCCLEHDLFYWAGGSKKQRLFADRGLRQCFRDVGTGPLADLVYIAVRTGRLYPFQFRSQQWGNAWSTRRNYRELSAADIDAIVDAVASYDVPEQMKQKLIRSLLANEPDADTISKR